MLVSKIISRAKFEARQNATTQYDNWLFETVQEELLSIHTKFNYQEIREDVILTLTAGVGYVALPSDFLRLANSTNRLKFYLDGTESHFRFLTKASQNQTALTVGEPAKWEIKNNRIYFYPYSLVLGTHRISISYYKKPATIAQDTDIQDDWAVIILNRLITRLLRMQESKSAAIYAKEANDKFLDSV